MRPYSLVSASVPQCCLSVSCWEPFKSTDEDCARAQLQLSCSTCTGPGDSQALPAPFPALESPQQANGQTQDVPASAPGVGLSDNAVTHAAVKAELTDGEEEEQDTAELQVQFYRLTAVVLPSHTANTHYLTWLGWFVMSMGMHSSA